MWLTWSSEPGVVEAGPWTVGEDTESPAAASLSIRTRLLESAVRLLESGARLGDWESTGPAGGGDWEGEGVEGVWKGTV